MNLLNYLNTGERPNRAFLLYNYYHMINIEGSNKLHDVYRLVWLLCTYLLFATLGYLVSYYYHVSTTIQSIIDRPVNCISTISLPIEQPKT